MSEYRIHWSISDCGKEILTAETKEDARKAFQAIPLTELLGTNDNFAHIMQIAKIKEAGDAGSN